MKRVLFLCLILVLLFGCIQQPGEFVNNSASNDSIQQVNSGNVSALSGTFKVTDIYGDQEVVDAANIPLGSLPVFAQPSSEPISENPSMKVEDNSSQVNSSESGGAYQPELGGNQRPQNSSISNEQQRQTGPGMPVDQQAPGNPTSGKIGDNLTLPNRQGNGQAGSMQGSGPEMVSSPALDSAYFTLSNDGKTWQQGVLIQANASVPAIVQLHIGVGNFSGGGFLVYFVGFEAQQSQGGSGRSQEQGQFNIPVSNGENMQPGQQGNGTLGQNGSALQPPPECVGLKATDQNLPQSCKVWFSIRNNSLAGTQNGTQNNSPQLSSNMPTPGSENLGILSSADGKTWNNEGHVVLAGKVNGGAAVDPTIVQLSNGSLRLYYFGSDVTSVPSDPASAPGLHKVYSAVSNDGINFAVEPGVRFQAGLLTDPEVRYYNGQWFMYYSLGQNTGVATSPDGLNFTVQNIGGGKIGGVPGALVLSNGVRLFACNVNGISSAFSSDGFNFTLEQRDIFNGQVSGVVCDPDPIALDNGTFAMVYKVRLFGNFGGPGQTGQGLGGNNNLGNGHGQSEAFQAGWYVRRYAYGFSHGVTLFTPDIIGHVQGSGVATSTLLGRDSACSPVEARLLFYTQKLVSYLIGNFTRANEISAGTYEFDSGDQKVYILWDPNKVPSSNAQAGNTNAQGPHGQSSGQQNQGGFNQTFGQQGQGFSQIGSALQPPPECVGLNATDQNLPQSCKVWFSIIDNLTGTQPNGQQPMQQMPTAGGESCENMTVVDYLSGAMPDMRSKDASEVAPWLLELKPPTSWYFGGMDVMSWQRLSENVPELRQAVIQNGTRALYGNATLLNRTLSAAQRMLVGEVAFINASGMAYARSEPGPFLWNVIEPDPASGVYHWDFPDLYVTTAQYYGVEPIVTVRYHNEIDGQACRTIASGMDLQTYETGSFYVYGPHLDGNVCNVDAYARWLDALVQRYGGDSSQSMPGLRRGLKKWEIFNEIEGSVGPAHYRNSSAYLQILNLSYSIIKKRCPDCEVSNDGAFDVDTPFSGSFWKANFASGALKVIDAFNWHWNEERESGTKEPDYQKAVQDTVNMMNVYGSSKPMWVTEIGTYTGSVENRPPVS